MSGIVNSTGARSGIVGTTVGVAGDPKIGKTCRGYLASTIAATGPNTLYLSNYGFTEQYNEDTTLFLILEGPSGGTGIRILVTGTYLFTWNIKTANASATGGLEEHLAQGTLGDSNIAETKFYISPPTANFCEVHTSVIKVTANNLINVSNIRDSGTRVVQGGSTGETYLTATYLHD